ncbi:unnamed protein product [Symbiodinium sp. CCMP2592]|nr:unnamed protein product [Symbiodinium sp. CCMP2592]
MPHVQSCTDLPEHAQPKKAPGLINIGKPRLQLSQLIEVRTGQAPVSAGELPQQEPSCASLQWLSVKDPSQSLADLRARGTALLKVQHPDQAVAKKHRNRGRKARESKIEAAESGDQESEANACEGPLSTGYFERSETATSSTCSSMPTAQAGQDRSLFPAPPGLERPIGWTLLESFPPRNDVV